MKSKIVVFLLGMVVVFAFASNSYAVVLFYDDFDSGARPEWGNEVGDWYVNNGAYYAGVPSEAGEPMTYTSITTLPNLTDFSIDVDVSNLRTGGIWLRSQDNKNGVLLVLGGGHGGYSGLYWHYYQNWGRTPPTNQK